MYRCITAWLLGCLCSWAAAQAPAAPTCPPPLAAASAAAAQDRGFLWRISRDGRVGWLYGTLHVGKPDWSRLGPQVSAALRRADVLALEIDPADPALLAALAQAQPSGALPEALPEALQQRLARAYERACVPAESMAALHPLLQATTLMLLEARWLGLDPSLAMEQLLAARARGTHRRIVALETAATQKDALVPQDSAQALEMLEQSLSQLEDESGRRVLARLVRAWESGDLGTLEQYEAWCECITGDADRAFLRKLNDDRNRPLADGIEAQHRAGHRVFAAVGALHMTGAQSLPRLLARRGFKVERIGLSKPAP